ncbi:MAG: DUF2442 domain-containing protein [Tissierellia bacterium]|nr:DUF2442 domain-containing protein [Tissierellia bacterium]
MNPKVKEVKPLEGYKLFLVFTNNEIGIFDVSQYLDDKFWNGLKDYEVFKRVKVSGGSTEWSNGADLCPDEIYEKSTILGKEVVA